VPRDGVRLLVARPGQIEHRRFFDLPTLLAPGDHQHLRYTAAVPGHGNDGRPAPVHVSTSLAEGEWVVEVRRIDCRGPDLRTHHGQRLHLPGGVDLRLTIPYPDPKPHGGASRLWRAQVTPPAPLVEYLSRHGRPIGYRYLAQQYPLADHQTVYAVAPGSAEMASAGRPFSTSLLVRLMALGITIATVVLHAGVSSPELHEPPAPERFEVPEPTARRRARRRRLRRRGRTPLLVARVRGFHPLPAGPSSCLKNCLVQAVMR
jgi:S-adenosylmethionine:tRNA ribosyltransferase-isomerase